MKFDKESLSGAFNSVGGRVAAGLGGAVGIVVLGHFIVPIAAVGAVGAGVVAGVKKYQENKNKPKGPGTP